MRVVVVDANALRMELEVPAADYDFETIALYAKCLGKSVFVGLLAFEQRVATDDFFFCDWQEHRSVKTFVIGCGF